MGQLTLKDISLGSTDAKNEVLNGTQEEISRFLASYVTPPALVIEKFFNRQKYYVVGLKGTGKTALLRYVSLKLEQAENSVSSFVLFKSDVDEDLRKDFAKAARVQVVEENSETLEGDDFETVWRWFIYRKIASAIVLKDASPFQENTDLSEFIALVNSETLNQIEKPGFMRLVPAIRKGNIEISKSPKLGLEFEWDANGRAKVNFNDLVRRADVAFRELEPDTERLNLFFDELEINYATSKQYQRDSRLVRDLIVAVEKINAIAKEKSYPLCLYAAIRSEVLVSVTSLGKEINKPIADFGSHIIWNRPGLSAEQQPLLGIIERRINNARSEHGMPALQSAELWSTYFPTKIHKQNPQIYILHNSWYRPRDVVRLLITVQDQYPDEQTFNVQGLEAVRKTYSTASWVELTEELKAKYKPSDIDGIKYIFYGFKQISSLLELSTRAERVALDHNEVKDLMSRVTIKEVLKDLYRIGVIGNIDKRDDRMRFSFRGDDEILFEDNVFVHNALKAHLSI
jgi:hypothetical protein